MNPQPAKPIVDILNTFPAVWERLNRELDKRIVGQDQLIKELLIAIFSRGHCLLIGVPGLAKTLLVQTFGEIAALNFKRIQFTPDMMPSDITGNEILEDNHVTGLREYKFIKGPVFAQLVLADEINRTPPKTQAALLEAMQEHSVTVAGEQYALEEPFFVLATQNPIEQEGTYPLPEAQLDRFMFCLNVDYPAFKEEVQILLSTTQDHREPLTRVITPEEIIRIQSAIREVPVPTSVAEYAVSLTQMTRPSSSTAPEITRKYLRWGAGPRASQYLALAGKVFAVLDGRYNVSVEDIQKAAHAVLRHRIILNYQAQADRETPETIITALLQQLPT
ncbi:MAG: MoxR family ATPase [Kiritimatiellales bacterium]|nr:MoxR family ATPase [Kiritimatiellales bacterium]